MALKVPIIIARFFTLTHYRSRLHHLLLALLQSLPCLHYLLTPFLHTLPITFSWCQMILKHFHDKMQPFSSLIFHLIIINFFFFALLFWSVHLVIYESFILLPLRMSPSPPADLVPYFEVSAFLVAQTAKNLLVNAWGPGSIPESGRPLEKGMATHSSIFAWEIPWTEQPGGLQSMRSQRVGHDWATEGKESACNAGDPGSKPGPGRSPREGNGTPLLYSCLGNPRIKEPGGLQSLGFKVLDTTERLTLFGKMFADLLKDPSEIPLWN